jgi:HAMP domain-containing protein
MGSKLPTRPLRALEYRLTHRAAGSVYHIKRVIDEIRSGNIKELVHLRPKDEFQDVAKSFNQIMDELQKEKASG